MSIRSAAALGLALVAAAALAGCAPEEPTSPSSPTKSASSTPTQSVPETLTPTPEPTASSTASAGWTNKALYETCVEYNAEWAADNGYDPDQFTWDPYSETMVGSEGAAWYVSLTGTITVDSKDVTAEFECAITGTPDSPAVKAVER